MKLIHRVVALTVFGSSAAAFSLFMTTSKEASTTVDRRSFLGSAAAIGAAAATGGMSAELAVADDDYSDFTTTESGLKYKITREGDGAVPAAGQTVKTQYTGWLDGFDSIRKFDSSRDRGRPFSFKVGAGQVIRGWDEAFLSMKVGERRQIILPSRLAYGERGAGGIIPGGATLFFDVELLAIM
mmetsp:Transcript_14196/g.22333  ORF Transcript_14196/g.22333 Transcript_14196/m.22333 type:complete len:184 (-) Transcript_14196:22-573(-)|eukprot:CAMPEP_0117046918 /NCGR_PEP_ID=MMETSP0472-20121206/32431_1 /TAXON_ID=693140 ORGANISM="Tiarina fusus, Strain LIS" /NCGR_SAMPLE_ID=MMETSP0472 /ASSEMBLY_ACC=CAM_ASM_000603 /LENGTH=183 /DNA_ID=CAMNT_0004759433 /DNA_START=77 /DNA_END=628 /DNA_ORIENTATION=+